MSEYPNTCLPQAWRKGLTKPQFDFSLPVPAFPQQFSSHLLEFVSTMKANPSLFQAVFLHVFGRVFPIDVPWCTKSGRKRRSPNAKPGSSAGENSGRQQSDGRYCDGNQCQPPAIAAGIDCDPGCRRAQDDDSHFVQLSAGG